jgi:hypothetical protein
MSTDHDDTWRDMVALLRALNAGDGQGAAVILGNADLKRVAAWLARSLPGSRDRQDAEAVAARETLGTADVRKLARVVLDRYAAAYVMAAPGAVTEARAREYIETRLADALASGPPSEQESSS